MKGKKAALKELYAGMKAKFGFSENSKQIIKEELKIVFSQKPKITVGDIELLESKIKSRIAEKPNQKGVSITVSETNLNKGLSATKVGFKTPQTATRKYRRNSIGKNQSPEKLPYFYSKSPPKKPRIKDHVIFPTAYSPLCSFNKPTNNTRAKELGTERIYPKKALKTQMLSIKDPWGKIYKADQQIYNEVNST